MAGLRSDLNDLRQDLRRPVLTTPQPQRNARHEHVGRAITPDRDTGFTNNAHHEGLHRDNGEGSSTGPTPGHVDNQTPDSTPRRIWNKRTKRSAEKNAFNVRPPSLDYILQFSDTNRS